MKSKAERRKAAREAARRLLETRRLSAHIPAHAYVEPAYTFHYGSDEDQAPAEQCLSFGPGGGFLYLADLGPHDFLYVAPPSEVPVTATESAPTA